MEIVLLLLAFLAFAGWAFSFYFLQVLRGNLDPDIWWMPSICRMSESSCTSITDTFYGKTFGQPNALWGSYYYPLVVLAVILIQRGFSPIAFLIIPATIAFLSSLYLLWGLYKLKTVCKVCLAVHVVNISSFFLVITVIGK